MDGLSCAVLKGGWIGYQVSVFPFWDASLTHLHPACRQREGNSYKDEAGGSSLLASKVREVGITGGEERGCTSETLLVG